MSLAVMKSNADRRQRVQKRITDSAQLAADLMKWSPDSPPRRNYREDLRWLHMHTDGLAQRLMLPVARTKHRHALAPSTLADRSTLPDSQVSDVIANLRRDGFSMLPWKLPTEVCDEVARSMRETKLIAIDGPYANHYVPFDKPGQTRVLGVPTRGLLNSAELQEVITDPDIYRIASDYIGPPVVVGGRPFLRWTMPSSFDESSFKRHQAAYFHQDFDALSSLRLFVYFTDVGPENAPLMLVPGSHKGRTRKQLEALWMDGKLPSKQEVQELLGENSVKEITGTAGTMFLMDSLSFHSASQASRDARLCLTLLYTATGFSVCAMDKRVPAVGKNERFRELVGGHDSALIEYELA